MSNPHTGFQGEDCVHGCTSLSVQVFSRLFSMPEALSESALNWVILAQLKRHHMCTAHQRQMACTWSWPRHWPQTENSGEDAVRHLSLLCESGLSSNRRVWKQTKKKNNLPILNLAVATGPSALPSYSGMTVTMYSVSGCRLERVYTSLSLASSTVSTLRPFSNYKNRNDRTARLCKRGTTVLGFLPTCKWTPDQPVGPHSADSPPPHPHAALWHRFHR